MLWGYLYFPQLQLDLLTKLNRKLSADDCNDDGNGTNDGNCGNDQKASNKPIAIIDTQHHQVIQLNPAAQQQGVSLMMGLATAAALCNELHVIPYDERLEQQELSRIVEHLYDNVADIACDGATGLYLRFGNMLRLYNGIEPLAAKLHQLLGGLAVRYHYASAYSPTAAKVLAESKFDCFEEDKKRIDKVLAKLPVTHVFKQTLEQQQLARLGIEHLSQLQQLPIADLSKRFSQSFLHDYLRLMGKKLMNIEFYQPKPHFYYHLELLYEISRVEVLLKPVALVLDKLAHFLLVRSYASHMLTLTCYYRDGSDIRWEIHSAEPCDSAAQWHQLIALQLAKIRFTQPVVAIALDCTQLALKTSITPDLFAANVPRLNLLTLVSLLQAKLGQEHVQKLNTNAEHQPELANQMISVWQSDNEANKRDVLKTERAAFQHFPDHMPHHSFRNKSQNDPQNSLQDKPDDKPQGKYLLNHSPILRPSYLLVTPEPLTERVSIIHGPERIETGWWQQTVVRDYFVAYNEQKQWCWVYRDHESRWFLHGYFG